MRPDGSTYLIIAAICFAGAAVTFLIFFGPGLAWRLRAWSWKGRALVFAGAAGLGVLMLQVANLLLR